jgi:alkanesulfonate monooxygenase SsuD/methylene tetrahydromethanopterin reductase-like flavin-dependent oxidoreductase (luciferase family)
VRVGVVILPQFSWPEARARWRSLEDRGFAHGWTYDHLAWRNLADQPWFGTIPLLTAVAATTTTLRLGTWVLSPNYRHPVPLAKDLMTVDDISAGRLIAGVGAGGIGWDATVLGGEPLPPRGRVDRLDEFVTLLDLLLRQAVTTWSGDHFTARSARMVPPGSRERIELVVAANGPRAMRIATRTDGWATTGPTLEESAPEQWWAGVAEMTVRMSDLLDTAGRDRETFRRYLNLDTTPVFSLSSIDAFDDAAGRAAELGFTDVVVHWPRAEDIYVGDDRILDEVAGRLRGGEILS